jgi:protein involved in polysaccharide export with SLBB domain
MPLHWFSRLLKKLAVLMLVASLSTQGTLVYAQSTGSAGSAEGESVPSGGPVRLRQPQQDVDGTATTPEQASPNDTNAGSAGRYGSTTEDDEDTASRLTGLKSKIRPGEYVPGEFEIYVQKRLRDPDLRRFGWDLVVERPAGTAARSTRAGSPRAVPPLPQPPREPLDFSSVAPPDYIVQPGDEVVLTMWGSVDADLHLIVDRSGRINIPRIGSVMVAGVRYADLPQRIDQQAAKVFRNYQLSVSLGRLRGVRVFVTGFATHPGSYTANSLSTMSSVLFNQAGGPSAAGSFRNVELVRGNKVVAHLDLYDLLIYGRRDADQLLQANDVINVGPVGPQVALAGSVNKPAIFELAPGNTVADLVRMGGGFSSVADRSHIAIEPLADRNGIGIRELQLPFGEGHVLNAGDIVRVFSAVESAQPVERQAVRVQVEGEVARPGQYVLPPGSTTMDAVKAAGGMTGRGYPFGTELYRESVRAKQQADYDHALIDLEQQMRTAAVRAQLRTDVPAGTPDKVVPIDPLLRRLRSLKPTGRVVLGTAENAAAVPDLALQDGDRLVIPALPTTVNVWGNVFSTGSYLYRGRTTVGDYLREAGNVRDGDAPRIFVVHANGAVSSTDEDRHGWFGLARDDITNLPAQPGDTIFVPENLDKQSSIQSRKDWAQIFYQFGLGLAALKSLTK